MIPKAQAQAIADSLKACPFCGEKPMASIRGAGDNTMNPKARCATENCMASRLPVICLDVPSDVEAWNTRNTAAPAEPIAWEAPNGTGLRRFVTDKQLQGFPRVTHQFYQPYRCVACSKPTDKHESP